MNGKYSISLVLLGSNWQCISLLGPCPSRGVPIYRIGKILAADVAKFAISAIGIYFEIVRISTDIFTCTNVLILLMHCLEFCCVICAVHRKNSLLCISDWLLILASFQVMNIGYRKT